MKALFLLHRHLAPLTERIAVLLSQDPEITQHSREAVDAAIASGATSEILANTICMLHTQCKTRQRERAAS